MSIGRVLVMVALAAIVSGSATLPPAAGVVAHEWGTFTSVADAEGNPLPWIASSGPTPLPCFVHHSSVVYKVSAPPTTVRMETPVIYFYAPRPTTLSVNVQFPRGSMTEWYPEAREGAHSLEWKSIEVLPGADLAFARGAVDNHYYAARNTDAAPLRAGTENEKLLFYRGIGAIDIPVRPRFKGGRIEIGPVGSAAAPGVILFENRGGKAGYRVIGELNAPVEVDPPELTEDVSGLRGELARALVTAGLYPKEAQAMLDTWRDSWFEEGLRVFYIAPRGIVDAGLPLTITPRPADIARVFVGRIEMLSPAIEQEIGDAVVRHNRSIYSKYGRFLQPFVAMMRPHNAAVAAEFPGDLVISAGPCVK